MRRKICLFCLLLVSMVCGGWIVYRVTGQSLLSQSLFVRKIKGLPAGKHDWVVGTYQGRLFVVDFKDKTTTFYAARIDPTTEKVVEEFKTKHFTPIAISAEREQRLDSWLAQDYDYWVLDEQSGIAYALKPVSWDEWDAEKRHTGVHVIDLKTRQVKKFLEISPMTGIILLHPDREKLYVTTEPKEAEIETGEIRVYSTSNWALLKTISYFGNPILSAEFTKDGSRLFCCSVARGILVIDTINDKLESWEPPADYPICFGIEDRNMISLALASDERELYIALEDEEERGAVAAIDIVQKKLVRTLELSPTTCTSVAVIGDKLFAACYDGVYVIDIPAWRQKQ